jgi:FPC/CPF motif-containing protein YcgG
MLNRFVGLLADKRRDRANLVVFFEPDPVPLSHGEYRTGFWEMLCELARHDPAVADRRPVENFDDPSWEFSFANQEFFVVAAVPTFINRRSRNLGQGMVVIFQPRQVFVGEANKEAVRRFIRQRGVAWDGISSHPDLGVYGEPHNREWTQYFLSDDSERERGRCPLAASRG